MREGASPLNLPEEALADWELPSIGSAVRAFLRTNRVPGWNREDLEQEARASWWGERRRYRAARGANPRTFLERVVRARLTDLLRAETAQKRGDGQPPASLDAPLDSDDGEDDTLLDILADRDPSGRPELVVHQRLLAAAVARARATLGAEDRHLLDAWMEGNNPRDLSVLLGPPRTTISSRLKKLFERLGSDELRNFL